MMFDEPDVQGYRIFHKDHLRALYYIYRKFFFLQNGCLYTTGSYVQVVRCRLLHKVRVVKRPKKVFKGLNNAEGSDIFGKSSHVEHGTRQTFRNVVCPTDLVHLIAVRLACHHNPSRRRAARWDRGYYLLLWKISLLLRGALRWATGNRLRCTTGTTLYTEVVPDI